MNFNFLPDNFAASTTQVAVAMLSNFSGLLTVIVGSMLVMLLIGILVSALWGHH